MLIKNNMTILFQGDSVTDAGRSRTDDTQLGAGYPNMIAAQLAAMVPELELRIYNRGISGNRVKDLKARWTEDAVALKPDIVSILIGINDTWRAFDNNDPTTAEAYREDYNAILARLKEETNAAIIMLEPFVLPYPEDRKTWREDLDRKIIAARELAAKYNALYIPLDGIFAAYCAQKRSTFWAADGVHPTQAGHAVIARHWLHAVGAL